MSDNEKVTNLSPSHRLRRALILDFDGTIRRSKSGKSFIEGLDEIELMPGVESRIMKYRQADYLIIGVTNQGGVAHGYKIPLMIEAEIERTFSLFKNNPFHIVKCCMHMEDGKVEPYCHRSLLRKPDIGMLALAEQDAFNIGFVIDWNNSLFVGDRPEDEQCAANAKIPYKDIKDFLSGPIVIEI